MGISNFIKNLFGELVFQSSLYYIEKIFDEKLIKIIKLNFVFLIIYIVALLIGKLNFLNENLRLFFSSSLILFVIIYSFIGFIKTIGIIYQYLSYKGRYIFLVDFSIRELMLDFLMFKYYEQVLLYEFFQNKLNKYKIFIPDSMEVYDLLFNYLAKRILIKLTYYGSAILFIVLVLRPGAIHYLSDVKWYFLYFTPFTISIDYVLGTNLTDWLLST